MMHLVWPAIFLLIAGCSALDPLYQQLSTLKFLNEGIVKSSDNYQWQSQCGIYVEPQNVSAVQSSWTLWGEFPYLYQFNSTESCTPSAIQNGTDRPGGDYQAYNIDVEDPSQCQAGCCADFFCKAWVYAIAPIPFSNCVQGKPCCYLKSSVSDPSPNSICTSGYVTRPAGTVPPTGMRSSVPLGGLGTGSFEIRADGSFHEWTIQNSGPAGGAKIQVLDEAVMGVYVKSSSSSTARLIRTHPFADFPGVEQITYGGAFPASRLQVNDSTLGVDATVYAFSPYSIGNTNASTVPATVLALAVTNTQAEEVEVSFLVNMPFGYEPDQNRFQTAQPFANVSAESAEQCFSLCHSSTYSKCVSWTFVSSTGTCQLKEVAELNLYSSGYTSGIKGAWAASSSALSYNRVGSFPASGGISLSAINKQSDLTVSFGTAMNFSSIWSQFSTDGSLTVASEPNIHGAIAVSVKVQPGETVTLPVVFSWYFPNRDWMGVLVGNFYNNIFSSSLDVSNYVSNGIETIVSDIQALQATMLGNSVPEFLQDSLINSLSHLRGGVYLADGRWRQYEAFDCDDIDSVHNDYQRQLPYMLFFPELIKNQMMGWAKLQLEDGMIQEVLANGWMGPQTPQPLDTGGGRAMGDVTSVFIMEAYQVYLWTGDLNFMQTLWPSVQAAIKWQIGNASLYGLPAYITCTYDILDLQIYKLNAFSGVMHLAAMQACQALAELMDAPDVSNACQQAFILGQQTMNTSLWNGQYFAAFNNGSAVMGDTLYGQVWLYTLGLPEIFPASYLLSHINAELEHNDSPFGILVMTGRNGEESQKQEARNVEDCNLPFQDNSIWMGGPTDWTTLSIHLTGNASAQNMLQAQKALGQFRSVLNDQWNIHGIIGGPGYGVDGQPIVTSHYGFHMVEWHIPFALSGQIFSAITQSLSFAPTLPVPFTLPVWTPLATGVLSVNSTTVQLEITSGSIQLQEIIYDGKPAPISGTLSLKAGGQYSFPM